MLKNVWAMVTMRGVLEMAINRLPMEEAVVTRTTQTEMASLIFPILI
jgi:hypothetical protein